MLQIQNEYLGYMKQLKQEVQAVDFPEDKIDSLYYSLTHTELLVPIIGAFSAGKSTLINSYLGQDILPVGITPETALATELRYSDQEYIEAIKADNTVVKYSIDEMDKIKASAKEYKFLKLFLNNDKLKTIEPLILVDMPGFDSPLDLHNQAIMNYINRGVHYIVLTSVEDGIITRSMVRQLSDIQEFGREFSFFLSKANLKADIDVNEIAEKIHEQLEEDFDYSKQIVAVGLNDGNNLEQVIQAIDPEVLFKNLFITELKNNYLETVDLLNISISALKKDKNENEEAISELKKGVELLVHKRNRMLDDAKEKYSDVNVNRIVESVGRDLGASMEELITSALNSGEDALSQHITEITRNSLLTKIKSVTEEMSNNIIDDFSFEIKSLDSVMFSFTLQEDWLEKASGSMKDIFSSTNSALQKILNNRNKKSDTGKIYKAITTVLAITSKTLHPALELLIVFLPEILNTVFGSMKKKKQEEQVRSQILTSVIPSIKRKLRSELPAMFNKQVNTLIKEIGTEFEGVLQEKQNAISAVESEKQNQITNIEEEVKKYNVVMDNASALANEVVFNQGVE